MKVVLYDGLCGFCDGAVRWILARDHREALHFAPLQGEFARSLRSHHPALHDVDALVLAEVSGGEAPAEGAARGAAGEGPGDPGGDRVTLRVRSDAALAIATEVGGIWRIIAGLARLIPRPLRDAVYDRFARNRYRWFARRESCRVPDDDQRARFLE